MPLITLNIFPFEVANIMASLVITPAVVMIPIATAIIIISKA